MEIREPKYVHDFYENKMHGDIQHYEKYFSQVKGLFKNSDGIDENTLMYTVYSCSEGDQNQLGNLVWGITTLQPIYVNGECNMTRGHYHENTNCAEFYFGTGGEGLLLFMDQDGNAWAEKVFKGSLHHVDGKVAHRFVNTGDEPCTVGACWLSAAGHNYEAIQEHDFPCRVFKRNGKIVIEER